MNWKLEKRNISEVKPYENNPRRITEKGMKDLKKSINKFGLAEPIVINQDGTIIGGHARYLALKEQGVKEFDCYVSDKQLEENELKELNVRLNKNIAGEFDFDILANHFDLDDLLEWGFEEKELDINLWKEEIPEEKLDEVPEPQKEAISKLGDIFLLDGKHRVMCGDSTKKEDVERLMDGTKARMSVTSPPYENQREYSQFKDYEDYLHFIDKIITTLDSISGEDFIVFWNIGSSEPTNNFIPADNYYQFKSHGYKWIEWIVWNKESATWTIPRSQHIENGLYIPALRWESCIVFLRGKRPHFDIEDKKEIREWQENVWNMNKVIGAEQKKIGHTALFPVELPKRAIKSYSKKQEVIFEPFTGGGSTLIASELTNRICYGMELDPIYIDVILRRYHNLYPDKKIECLTRDFDFNSLWQGQENK